MVCEYDSVEKSFGRVKNKEVKQSETRFQFGGFIAQKQEDQGVNVVYSAVDEFEDMPVEGECVTRSTKELKDMEYKSMERRRRIQHEKYNDRRKAAMKRKN